MEVELSSSAMQHLLGVASRGDKRATYDLDASVSGPGSLSRSWSETCRAIRARVLAIADKMRDLPARQHVTLSTELRAALTDLVDGGTSA